MTYRVYLASRAAAPPGSRARRSCRAAARRGGARYTTTGQFHAARKRIERVLHEKLHRMRAERGVGEIAQRQQAAVGLRNREVA